MGWGFGPTELAPLGSALLCGVQGSGSSPAPSLVEGAGACLSVCLSLSSQLRFRDSLRAVQRRCFGWFPGWGPHPAMP